MSWEEAVERKWRVGVCGMVRAGMQVSDGSGGVEGGDMVECSFITEYIAPGGVERVEVVG